MISLEAAGAPRDHQIPDLSPAVVQTLVDHTIDAAGQAAPPARRALWLRRTSLVAAAAVAAITAAVLMPGPPAQAAGWAPVPTIVVGSTEADLAAACQQMMGTDADAVIVEQRGTSHLTVLSDSTECLNASDLGVPGTLTTGGRNSIPAQPTGATDVQVVQNGDLDGVGHTGEATGHTIMTAGYMGVIGRAGSDVTSIVVHTAGQPDITASLHNGWFAAWWPSVQEPSSLTVFIVTGSYQVAL